MQVCCVLDSVPWWLNSTYSEVYQKIHLLPKFDYYFQLCTRLAIETLSCVMNIRSQCACSIIAIDGLCFHPEIYYILHELLFISLTAFEVKFKLHNF